jgi:hypothetical protein
MMRSPVIVSNAIFLRASWQRPMTAVPCFPESDDDEPRKAPAPRSNGVPRPSNSFRGRPNGREAKNNAAEAGLGQTGAA